MHTSKSPSDNAQSQPVAQQKNGAAVVSPQSEQLMQLEILEITQKQVERGLKQLKTRT
jgi:hypothetical protein